VRRRSPMLHTHSPLTSNSRATSFRNGSSRRLKYRPSPIRRRCANLKLSTRTACRRALTRAARNWNPFRRLSDTRENDRAAGLAPILNTQLLIVAGYATRTSAFTQLSYDRHTQKSGSVSFLSDARNLRLGLLAPGPPRDSRAEFPLPFPA